MVQANNNDQALQKITAQNLAAKYRGKQEIYNLLTVDVGYYLPPYKNLTVYWLKDLMSKKKLAVKNDRVKHLYVPQYNTLSIKLILEWAQRAANIEQYLPDEKDIPALPRQWIINLCYTIIGDRFALFVRSKVDDRHEKLADKQNLNIMVDPEIMEIIKNSSAVSTQKGNAASLLKIGTKRRRTRAELEELKMEELNRLAAAQEREDRIIELENLLNASKQKVQAAHSAQAACEQLLEAGMIAQAPDGTFIPPSQPMQE